MTPQPHLDQDLRFLLEAGAWLQKAGVMRTPRFDRASCALIEGGLQIDLLNVWHQTQQLTHPQTPAILERWVRPPTLAAACNFGRVDVVEAAIEAGAALDQGDPIAAAAGAYVVTSLHVRCVALLLGAGARVTQAQLWAHAAESMGSPEDGALYALLVQAARRSPDPAVRALVGP